MNSTSISLLRRLQKPNEEAAWQRFVELYAPLIFHWGRGHGLDTTDAADLVQEVMAILVVKLPEFSYDPSKRFRGWLRIVTVNAARNFQRRESARPVTRFDETLQSPPVTSGIDLFEEAEYQGFLAKRAIRIMQAEFQETTWQACWRHVVDGRKASDVAIELGITANAVYIAKYRVMRRLREELVGLIE